MFRSTWSRSERLFVAVEMSLRYFASMNQTQVWRELRFSLSAKRYLNRKALVPRGAISRYRPRLS